MSDHSEFTDFIPIERLATGNIIFRKGDDFGSFGAFAEVQTVEFDDEGYLVKATFMDTDGEVAFWVRCGESVEHGGSSAPILRQTSFVTAEEWKAKAEAIEAATDVIFGKIFAASGHVCRPVDEAKLVGAVAEALDLPMAQAAE